MIPGGGLSLTLGGTHMTLTAFLCLECWSFQTCQWTSASPHSVPSAFSAATTLYPTLVRWRLRRHTGSRVRRQPRRLLCRSTGRFVKEDDRQVATFSTQLHESCQTAASTIEDWPISGALFCLNRCTSVGTVWLLDTWSISADMFLASTATDILDLLNLVVYRCCGLEIRMSTYGIRAFKLSRPFIPNYLKTSTLSVYF